MLAKKYLALPLWTMSKSVPTTTARTITTRNPCRNPAGNDAPATANGLTLSMAFSSPASDSKVASGRPTSKSCYEVIQRLNGGIGLCLNIPSTGKAYGRPPSPGISRRRKAPLLHQGGGSIVHDTAGGDVPSEAARGADEHPALRPRAGEDLAYAGRTGRFPVRRAHPRPLRRARPAPEGDERPGGRAAADRRQA